MTIVPHTLLAAQIRAVFLAWGMRPEPVETAVDLMVEADLRGIDSHGVGMLPTYDQRRRDGEIDPLAEVRTLREGPVLTLVDAGHGIGHPAARFAMERACDKAASAGLGVSVVVHSNHFGAAGVYSTIAAERGLVGFGLHRHHTARRGADRRPRAALLHQPDRLCRHAGRKASLSSLDMATSTVAVGKLNVARRAGKPLAGGLGGRAPTALPETRCGRRLQRPAAAAHAARRQPHTRQPQGLRAGGDGGDSGEPAPRRPMSAGSISPPASRAACMEIGHFFLALDPAFFNPGFAADLGPPDGRSCAPAPPADPVRPVLAPGDPEHEERRRAARSTGIPMTETLVRGAPRRRRGARARPSCWREECPAAAC